MPAESASAVLHITAAAGGGADRYIRDLAATTTRTHFALHVGSAIDVLENLAARRFAPLSAVRGDLATRVLMGWVADAGVGMAHLHSVDARCRERLDTLLRAVGL